DPRGGGDGERRQRELLPCPFLARRSAVDERWPTSSPIARGRRRSRRRGPTTATASCTNHARCSGSAASSSRSLPAGSRPFSGSRRPVACPEPRYALYLIFTLTQHASGAAGERSY